MKLIFLLLIGCVTIQPETEECLFFTYNFSSHDVYVVLDDVFVTVESGMFSVHRLVCGNEYRVCYMSKELDYNCQEFIAGSEDQECLLFFDGEEDAGNTI